MKKLAVFLVVATAFVWVFVKSETLEVREATIGKSESGFKISETHTSRYIFHWDRFFRYLEQVPAKIRAFIEGLTAQKEMGK